MNSTSYRRTRGCALAGLAVTALGLLLAAAAPGTASAEAPTLNVEPSCRFQAAMQPPPDRQTGFQRCMEQEDSAKAELDKSWAKLDLEDRAQCLDMTNELGGKTASYVEVLECAVLMRDARAMDKKDKEFQTNTDISVGLGQ
jgi:hypothetical protein